MRFLKKNRLLQGILCLLALGAAATGCIKEDSTGCSKQFTLIVRAYDADDNEVAADVHDVTLYVFDESMRLLQKISTTLGSNVAIDLPASGGVHIVGWGNMLGGSHSVSMLDVGDPLSAGLVSLAFDTRAALPYYSPGDLFFGTLAIAADVRGEQLLPVHRKVGSMAVTVRGLKQWAGFNDNDYHVVVRQTPCSIDFTGACIGPDASYSPDGSFAVQSGVEQYVAPAFNTIPNPDGVSVEIYHGSTLLYTATTYNGGSPIALQQGRLTNVLVNFIGQVSVSVAITNWGDEQYWKQF